MTMGPEEMLAPAWARVVDGLRWSDMPGADEMLKKMNFFFFRRGLLQRDENGEWVSLENGQRIHRGFNRRREGSMRPAKTGKLKVKLETKETNAMKQGKIVKQTNGPRGARELRPSAVDRGFFGGEYGWLDDPMSVGKRTSCRLSAEQGEALIERLGAARVTAGVIWRDVASATGVSSSQLSRLRQFPEGMAARPVARLLAWCDSVDGLRGFAGAPVAEDDGGKVPPPGPDVVTLRREMFEGQEDEYCKLEEGRKDDAPAHGGTVVAVDVQGESVKSVVVPRQPVARWPVCYSGVVPLWLDLETGGFDAERNPIVEIAAYQRALWFVRPVDWAAELEPHGLEFDLAAVEMNGANAADWPGPDSPVAVPVMRALLLLARWALSADLFEQWMEGYAKRPLFVCGANPQFDVDFLNASCRRHGLPELARRGLDVQQEAMALLWDGAEPVPSFSSDNLSEALGMLPEARPHRAMAGVKQAMALHAEIRRRAGLTQ